MSGDAFYKFLCTVIYRTFEESLSIMGAQASKDERIELRVSSSDKRIFKKAQELSGDKSFSSFIVRVVKQRSEEILARNNRIIETEKDRQIFFDSVFSNSKPNQNLLEAADRFKSKKA